MSNSLYIVSAVTLLAALVPAIAYSMGLWGNKFPLEGRVVVVTGGSQGMGRGVAKLLSQKGAHVTIVARDLYKLDAALVYICAASKYPDQKFQRISADLTDPKESIRVLEEATKFHGIPPDIVWAVAGTSIPKLFLDANIETLRGQMEINYWAGAYLAHAALQMWLGPHIEAFSGAPSASEKKTGSRGPEPPARHLILTSSSAAFVGVAGYAPYSPPKAAQRSLCDTLQSEMELYNGAFQRAGEPIPKIKIHNVFPGTIDSPGRTEEDKVKHPVTFELEKDDPVQSEDEVAAAAVAGLEKGQFLIVTNWLAALMRFGIIGGSPRNGFGVVDTIMAGIINPVWLAMRPILDKTVRDWGKKNGIYGAGGRKG